MNWETPESGRNKQTGNESERVLSGLLFILRRLVIYESRFAIFYVNSYNLGGKNHKSMVY